MRIFLVIFDTLRKDHTGKTYGNDWIKTPNFDILLSIEHSYPPLSIKIIVGNVNFGNLLT